jgi:hypothetical protein
MKLYYFLTITKEGQKHNFLYLGRVRKKPITWSIYIINLTKVLALENIY